MADSLRPAVDDALAAWLARVSADKRQVEGAREVQDPADFYAPRVSSPAGMMGDAIITHHDEAKANYGDGSE